MGRHRTPEEKAAFKVQATEMRAAGMGVKRIASALHVDPVLIRQLLADVPLPANQMRLRAKDDHRDAAIAMRLEGRSYNEIKAELGVGKGSLSLWLRELPAPSEVQRAALRARAGEPSDDKPLDDPGLARALRLDGWLLREIAEELGVSVKTACIWCEGLPIPARATTASGRKDIADAGRAYWDAKRPLMEAERLSVVSRAAAVVPPVTDDLLLLLAAVAYWCEGAKSKPWAKKERLTIVNQDPNVIRLFVCWLRRTGVAEERLTFRVNIHESADVLAATGYWADVVGVPVESFARATLKRHNPKTVRHNVGDGYHGCLTVDVRLSRDLYRLIEGTWQGLVRNTLAGRPANKA